MSKPAKRPTKKGEKRKYKVRNWKEYNEALVNRGRILFQITEEAIKHKTGNQTELGNGASIHRRDSSVYYQTEKLGNECVKVEKSRK